MKTEVHRKLKISRSIIILFGFCILIELINCTGSDQNTTANVGYGKSFFYQNCSSCHGRNDGFANAPNLVMLNNYDSVTLVKKLNSVRKDSIHSTLLENITYSKKEIISIEEYIKAYFEPHY